MKIRTLLLSCVAIVLVATTAFAQTVNSTHGNCSQDPTGDWLCTASHSRDVLFDDPTVYNLLEIGVTGTGILTNTGDVGYYVTIEQGLKTSGWAWLDPGQARDIGPLDNNIFSWAVFAPAIGVPQDKAPQAKARIHINARTPPNRTCGEVCTDRVSSCHQGCSLDPHANAWCHAGCDAEGYRCLGQCK
jgi:hypothetical protein